jgi:hypothetical protein
MWSNRVAGVTALVGCAALCVAASAAAKPPTVPELPIPVHIVFAGSGEFHYDNSAGFHVTGDDQLSWDVDYDAQMRPDGSLTAEASQPPATAGDYTFDDFFFEVACSGPISTVPEPGPFEPGFPDPPPETTPAPKADGLLIEGITYLSSDPEKFSNCTGKRGDFDGSGEAADGVGRVLDQDLPGALTAHIPAITRPEFLAGGVARRAIDVSYADAPTQIPESCADLFGIEDPSKCQIGLDWTGTVSIDGTAGCPVILYVPALACMPPSGTPVGAFIGGVEIVVTGPGAAGVSATAAGAGGSASHAVIARQIVIASGSSEVKRPGRIRVRPRLTAAGRRLFKHSRRLKVRVKTVFKPKHGHARTTRVQTILTSS